MELRDLIEAHKDLITDLLDPDFGLFDELLASRSLTRPEVAKIKAAPDSYGRSEKLMEYIFNKGIYEKFLDALRKTQQTHLAKFILSTGEVVRVRSELETESDVNEVEDELIIKFTEMLEDRSLKDSARILECTQLRLIAAKKGNSVIPYRSKTLTELVDLQEIQTAGKLANVVGEMFNSVGAKDESCDKDDGSYASNTTKVSDKKKAQDTTQKPEEQHLEITECPICLNVFTDPRILPCIHTFCFECLKRTSEATQKKPGDKMPCPLCRKEFIIPADGMNGVQKNFFLENLLDFKLAMHMGNFCTKHIHKPLDYYCAECKKTVCVLCIVESHKLHGFKDVTKVDKDFRKTIEIKALKISTYTNEMLFMKSINDKNKADFLEEIDDTEKEIHEKNQELKDMIDRHTRSLLDELSLIKSKHLKEIENQVEEIERYRTVVGSFEVYCKELTLKGSASDICSSVDQLLARADELEREEKAFIGRLHQSVQVSFQATDLGYVLPNTYINFVGAVEETNAEYENFALIVGIADGKTETRDVVKINLNQPNEITTDETLPTSILSEAFAAVYKNTMYVTGIGVKRDEIWKYKKSCWKKCASLVQGRIRHSAAFIDEMLYICGGFVDSTNLVLDSVEAFNAVTNNCAAVGKLVIGVESTGNCVPYKNSLYIFGGGDKDNIAINHIQVYNTKDNTCSVLSRPMPWSYYLIRVILWETSAILLGYNICFIFNIETETWQERKQFKTDVTHFGLVLANERVFVIGGGDIEEDNDGNDVWRCRDDIRYVPLQNIIDDKPIEWKIHGKLPQPCLVQAYANIRQLRPQST